MARIASVSKNVTCNKCGWVHFEVSRKFAEAEVKRFQEYYDALTKEKQEFYYGSRPAQLTDYERCILCSSMHTEFRDSIAGDCPNGCTLSPIINRNEPRDAPILEPSNNT